MAKIFKDFFPHILIFLISLFLLTFKLAFSPVHLNQDEMMFALNAKNITENGHDFYGNVLPFYFWHLNNFWATPVIVYFSAVFLKFLPFNESTIRFPTVFLGIVDIGLLMYLVKLIFNKRYLTILSGIFLVTTPAFFINSRLMLDNIYPVVFVLLWLIFLVRRKYLLAGLMLGLGIHSYHAGKIYFPLYFLASLFYLNLKRKFTIKKNVIFAAGFLIPIIIFIPWLIKHPNTLSNQVSYAQSIDKNLGSNILSNYLPYFDPKILFVEGDRTLIHSTKTTGIFLFPSVFLIVFGVLQMIKNKDRFSWLIFFGLLSFPLAPSIISDPGRISRALVVIPFGILLSIYGFEFFMEQKDEIFRYLVYGVLGFSAVMFLAFLNDYFGNYRIRSYSVFNNDIGGAMESALSSTKVRKVTTIYLDRNINYADLYFKFYALKKNITFDNFKTYDPRSSDFLAFPKGSLVVLTPQDLIGKPEKIGGFEKIETIREPDGNESYFIYWRDDS